MKKENKLKVRDDARRARDKKFKKHGYTCMVIELVAFLVILASTQLFNTRIVTWISVICGAVIVVTFIHSIYYASLYYKQIRKEDRVQK